MSKRRKGGRPADFTPPQNRALRALLREMEQRYTSQRELGELLGIKQQNVSRLLNDRDASLSYSTARGLVRLAGHMTVDAFFAARGLAEPLPALAVDVPHARAS